MSVEERRGGLPIRRLRLTPEDLVPGRTFYTQMPKDETTREEIIYKGEAVRRGRLNLHDPLADMEFTARRGEFLRGKVGPRWIVDAGPVVAPNNLTNQQDNVQSPLEKEPNMLFVVPKSGEEPFPVIVSQNTQGEAVLIDPNEPRGTLVRTNTNALEEGGDENFDFVRVPEKFSLIFASGKPEKPHPPKYSIIPEDGDVLRALGTDHIRVISKRNPNEQKVVIVELADDRKHVKLAPEGKTKVPATIIETTTILRGQDDDHFYQPIRPETFQSEPIDLSVGIRLTPRAFYDLLLTEPFGKALNAMYTGFRKGAEVMAKFVVIPDEQPGDRTRKPFLEVEIPIDELEGKGQSHFAGIRPHANAFA